MHNYEELLELARAKSAKGAYPPEGIHRDFYLAEHIGKAVEALVPQVEEIDIEWFLTMLSSRPGLFSMGIEGDGASVQQACREVVVDALMEEVYELDFAIAPEESSLTM